MGFQNFFHISSQETEQEAGAVEHLQKFIE